MRGITVVLVLVCLVSSALAAIVCNNGVASADSTGCVCMSGYAAADSCLAATLANVGGSCASKALQQTEATWFPNLAEGTSDPLTSPVRFVGNKLYAKIVGNYVAARTYNELTFVQTQAMKDASTPVAAACKLGNTGSYWAQSVNTGACNDTFDLVLPWANHPGCGFANNTAKSDSEWMYISGYMYIKYTDALGEVDGFNLTRSTKVPYSVSVKFQRHVTVQLQKLNVTSDVKYGMALTEDTYDPEAQMLTLEITSIVNWPNKFFTGEALTLFKPEQVLPQYLSSKNKDLFCSASSCTDGGSPRFVGTEDITCSQEAEKSLCTQKFHLKAMLDQTHTLNCTYDGKYDITAPLYTCRDTPAPGRKPDCTNADLNITFTIQDSYVCGVIGVTPNVDGKLFAFDPSQTEHFGQAITDGKAKTNFQLGKYANFFASIDSAGNTVSLLFREISFTEQGKSNWVRLYNSSGWTADNVGNAYQESFPAIPAMDGNAIQKVYNDKKYFQVYFHSSIFKVNPNSQVIYTFRATIDLSFQGNEHFKTPLGDRKRTIETTWEQSVFNAETNVFMRAPAAEVAAPPAQVAPEQGVSSVTFIASVVGAVAGTMIIVFVVVGFALRARSQAKDESSSSLLAASAAAAEIANRA